MITFTSCNIFSAENLHYSKGLTYWEKGEYQKGIEEFSKSIEANPKFVSSYFFRGSSYFKLRNYEAAAKDLSAGFILDDTWDNKGGWTHLRGQAYEALGRLQEAIADYRTAIARGRKYTTSATLSSNPRPGAKAEWFRELSSFHNSLGIVYAKAGKYEDALLEFREAIGVAGSSVNKVGLTDKLVAKVFAGETGKRKEFAKAVGAYCYNIGVMEEKLGRSSNAKEIARQLEYDRTLVVVLK
jgi:tetratricopeptide (TPR) repeat protein